MTPLPILPSIAQTDLVTLLFVSYSAWDTLYTYPIVYTSRSMKRSGAERQTCTGRMRWMLNNGSVAEPCDMFRCMCPVHHISLSQRHLLHGTSLRSPGLTNQFVILCVPKDPSFKRGFVHSRHFWSFDQLQYYSVGQVLFCTVNCFYLNVN